MEEFSTLQKISIWVLPVLFAITIHEVSHGWVANLLGDPTAKMLGRLSINPIKHIDPVGTVVIPAITLLLTGFIFGYAKPVPVTFENLRNPKRDMAWVALAGPGSNLLMAVIWALWIRLALQLIQSYPTVGLFMIASGIAGILVNLILMVLNLIPLPPLDGGRVMTSLLPTPIANQFAKIEPFGFIILIFLLVVGILGSIIWPIVLQLLLSFMQLAGLTEQELSTLLVAIGALRV